MAKMYRTPPVLANMSRGSRRIDSSGGLLEADKEQATEAPNVLSRVLKKLDILVDEELKKPVDERKPITQNMLGEEAATKGSSYERYDYVFKDTLEMLNKYFLCTVQKDSSVPDFETLKRSMDKIRSDFVLGDFDKLAKFTIERYGDFEVKLYDASDAYTAHFADGLRIHPCFGGYGINDIADMIYEEYQKVQELQEEYDRLKAESSNR